jgi:hypothetical protein
MVLITVTGDHDRPEWLITINGIRSQGQQRRGLAFPAQGTPDLQKKACGRPSRTGLTSPASADDGSDIRAGLIPVA